MRFLFKAVMKFENHRFWSLRVSLRVRQGNQVKNNSNILHQIKVLFFMYKALFVEKCRKICIEIHCQQSAIDLPIFIL